MTGFVIARFNPFKKFAALRGPTPNRGGTPTEALLQQKEKICRRI